MNIQQSGGGVSNTVNTVLGIIGACLGSIVGFLVFRWLWSQGFYAIALPGFFVGFLAGAFLRRRSKVVEVLCVLLALIMGLFCEWYFFPFSLDKSLIYFLSHLHLLKSITWIMIVLGVFMGYYSSVKRCCACGVTQEPFAAQNDDNISTKEE